MTKTITFYLFVLLLILTGCSESAEEPGIDCSGSDLEVEVISSVKSDCDQPGSITLEASGGEGAYSFSIDGASFQDSNVFINLFAGDFILSVRDDKGCTASTNFTLQSEPTGITLSLSGSTSDCFENTGTITVTATGGVGELLFSVDNGNFTNSTEYSGIGPGNHTVVVKDAEECRVTKTIQITTTTSLLNDIMPIIQNDCAISGCHNGSQAPRLMTASEVIQNANFIRSETQAGSMPRDRTLTQNEIDLIACWVDDGAKDN